MMMSKGRSRLGNAGRRFGAYVLIVALTLVVFDILLIALDLFPPRYETGDPVLGWATKAPDVVPFDRCKDMSSNTEIRYFRNELGIRTSLDEKSLRARKNRLVVGAIGDSQSDQCAENEDTHQGVLESELHRRGIDTLVLSNGVSRYSPLQSYLLFKNRLSDLNPDVLLLNLYTGNDFVDMLRTDDRPHLVRVDHGYEIRPPKWYRYYDPEEQYSSRVMYVTRSLLDGLGIRSQWQRFRMHGDSARLSGKSLGTVFRYLNDVRRSISPDVGYIAAFSAQFLNQQLYFHHFPGSDNEALRRIAYLMRLIRKEYPDLMLIMSPIPSYQLIGEEPVDPRLKQTLQRLPLSHESCVRAEEKLYYSLREISAQEGWIFVDNLKPMREYSGNMPLFNDFDFHVTRAASRIIGSTEASAIELQLNAEPPNASSSIDSTLTLVPTNLMQGT